MMEPKFPRQPLPAPDALARAQARLLAEFSRITADEATEPPPAGEAAPAPDPDPAHERYRFDQVFARGGLGTVRRALDRKLGRTVAIKELLRFDDKAIARFVREASITARLQHPGIVPLYDLGRDDDGRPFLAMRLVEGASLADRLAACPDLGARLGLLHHVVAAADAIAYAHRNQIIHRDIKPANILVGDFGETVVIDWGLAKDLASPEPSAEPADPSLLAGASDLTTDGSLLGTLRYMPPEQARGERVDARSDVYALGAVLYHLLAGAPPFHDRVGARLLHDVLEGRAEPLGARAPAAPRELITIAAKAMAQEPDDRYPSAEALADELRRFQNGRLVDAHRYSLGDLGRLWLGRHRTAATIAAAAIVAMTAGGAASYAEVRAARDRAELALVDADHSRHLAEERAREADAARRLAEERADKLLLSQARLHLSEEPGESLGALARLSPPASEGGEARVLAAAAVAHGAADTALTGSEGPTTAVLRLADGSWITATATALWRWVPGAAAGEALDAHGVLVASPNRRRWAVIGPDAIEVHELGVATPRRVPFTAPKAVFTQWTLRDDGAALLGEPTIGDAPSFEIDLTTGEHAPLPGPAAPPAVAGLRLTPAPTGDRFAGVRDGRALVIWDRRSGAVDEVALPGRAIGPIQWSPKGKTLVLAAATGPAATDGPDRVVVWRHGARPRVVDASHAALVADAVVFLDTRTPTPRAFAEDLAGAPLWTRSLRAPAQHPFPLGPIRGTGGRFVAWRDGQTWSVVDAATGDLVHTDTVASHLWLFDALVVTETAGGLAIRDLQQSPWKSLTGPTDASPPHLPALTRRHFARLRADGQVERIKATNGALTRISAEGCGLDPAPGGVVVADDGRVLLLASQGRACLLGQDAPFQPDLPGDPIVGAALRPAGGLTIGLASGAIYTWTDTSAPPRVLEAAPLNDFSASDDGRVVVTAGIDGTITRISPEGEAEKTLVQVEPDHYISGVALSRSGNALAATVRTGRDEPLRVFYRGPTRAPRELPGTLPQPLRGIRSSLAFSPSGRVLAALSGGSLLHWNLADPAAPTPIEGLVGQVILRDDRSGVVVAPDGALDLVDLEAGTHARIRPGEEGTVRPQITAVDDGFLVATPTGALLRWRDPVPQAGEEFGAWLRTRAPKARPRRR